MFSYTFGKSTIRFSSIEKLLPSFKTSILLQFSSDELLLAATVDRYACASNRLLSTGRSTRLEIRLGTLPDNKIPILVFLKQDRVSALPNTTSVMGKIWSYSVPNTISIFVTIPEFVFKSWSANSYPLPWNSVIILSILPVLNLVVICSIHIASISTTSPPITKGNLTILVITLLLVKKPCIFKDSSLSTVSSFNWSERAVRMNTLWHPLSLKTLTLCSSPVEFLICAVNVGNITASLLWTFEISTTEVWFPTFWYWIPVLVVTELVLIEFSVRFRHKNVMWCPLQFMQLEVNLNWHLLVAWFEKEHFMQPFKLLSLSTFFVGVS